MQQEIQIDKKLQDQQKIEKLNDSIKNSFRLAFIFLVITAAIIVWLLIWSIIFAFIESEHNILSAFENMGYVWGGVSVLLLNTVAYIIRVYIIRKKEQVDYSQYKFIYIISFMDTSIFIVGSIMGLIYSVIYIASGELVSIIGERSGILVGIFLEIFYLFMLLGYICLFVSCCKVVKKYKIEYADDIRREKERQRKLEQKQAEEKQHEKDLNTVSSLLSKVGNKFFVKYYNELRDWAEPDIIDIIEENYSEESKQQRIRNAKEIFDKKLNVLALTQISSDKNVAIDEQTKETAKLLLEQQNN